MNILNRYFILFIFYLFSFVFINSEDISLSIKKIKNNNTMVTVYCLGEYGDQYPLVTGNIAEFNAEQMVIFDSNSYIQKIEINMNDIVYLIIHDNSEESSVLYLKEEYKQNIIEYNNLERGVPDGMLKEIEKAEKEFENEISNIRDNLLSNVDDLMSLLEFIIKNKKIIIITGFDESITVTELAEGLLKEFNKERLVIVDSSTLNNITLQNSDILYIDILDLNGKIDKFRIYINPDQSTKF